MACASCVPLGRTILAPKTKAVAGTLESVASSSVGGLVVGLVMGLVENPSTSGKLLFLGTLACLSYISLINRDHTIGVHTCVVLYHLNLLHTSKS